MSSFTIEVNDVTLKKINDFYKDDIVENNNPHALFVAKIDGCTITAYKSKKVMFQGNKAEEELNIWTQIKLQQTKEKPHLEDYYKESIGSDEVGTGDYFGPVVVVSCFLDHNHLIEIQKLNINDSKKLNDTEIQKIAPTLFKLLPYSLLVVKNEKYNDVMEKDMNLNKLKALLHKQAITHLLNKLNKRTYIIIDQFCEVDHFNRYVKDTTFSKGVHFTTKAESKYACVACASIMARYIFLQEMDELSKDLNVTLKKGASSLVDEQGKQLVDLYGKDILKKIAKLHFKNTEKIFMR